MPKFQKSSRNFLKGPSMYSSPVKNYSVEKGSHSHPHAPTKYASPTKNHEKGHEKTKTTKTSKTKEQLLAEGFNQADADQMILDGATTGKTSKNTKNKVDTPKDQSDFKPAFPGADYSKEDIAKMSEKEKIAKIDGYTPKKNK